MAKVTASVALILSYLAQRVVGHGAVTSYVIGGTTYPGYTGFSPASSPATIELQWPDYNPTFDPADSKITCNGGTSAALTASIAAGGSITAKWAQWTHAQGSVSVYMKACSSFPCTPAGSGWFKIDESGLLSGTMFAGTWGIAQVLNTGAWTSTIPSALAAGNYLIRHELLAVHQSNAPQFYAECAQLVVTGSGSTSPSGSYVTSIPGYCSKSDPNVTFDIYADAAKTVTSWDVPGPPVWKGDNTAPATTAAPIPITSATRTTAGVPATTSAAVGTVPLYGQCGGSGWTGGTVCISGTCTAQGDYYSQCVP